MTDEKTAGDRIAKVMARAGVASRRDAERMIVEGRVAVNGKPVTSPALDVAPTDRVTLDGKPIDAPQAARLWLYYKPLGLVTSNKDEKGRQTVFDTLPQDMPRVMSIGRLDLNSEGLLLLTNDGALKRRLELPSTGWLRKYRVRVNGRPNDATFDPLRRGVTVEGEDFLPMDISLDRQQGANAWLTVGLREGKNREIRRAMNHIGLTVNRLIRISYGPFRLNELQPGEVEELKPRVLREQLGLSDPEEAPKPVRKLAPRPGKTGTRSAGPGEDRATAAKPKLKPGEGLKQLSDSWKKATRPAAGRAERTTPDAPAQGRPAPGRPAKDRPARPHGTPSRPGPRPGGPKKG